MQSQKTRFQKYTFGKYAVIRCLILHPVEIRIVFWDRTSSSSPCLRASPLVPVSLLYCIFVCICICICIYICIVFVFVFIYHHHPLAWEFLPSWQIVPVSLSPLRRLGLSAKRDTDTEEDILNYDLIPGKHLEGQIFDNGWINLLLFYLSLRLGSYKRQKFYFLHESSYAGNKND